MTAAVQRRSDVQAYAEAGQRNLECYGSPRSLVVAAGVLASVAPFAASVAAETGIVVFALSSHMCNITN